MLEQQSNPLIDLRARIARLERGETDAGRYPAMPFDIPAIDAALPGGGLASGAVHEVTGSAAGGFVSMLAGRADGPVLWCVMARSGADLYGPGLAAFGLDTDRLVIARCATAEDMLWAMEEGLRDPGVAAVVGEPDRAVALTASRRLQLAAETGGGTGLVLRRGAGKGDLSPSAVFSRWQAESAPLLGLPGMARTSIGGTRWRLELLRCRGGIGGMNKAWLVEWCDATCDFSLVSDSVDRSGAAREGQRLAG